MGSRAQGVRPDRLVGLAEGRDVDHPHPPSRAESPHESRASRGRPRTTRARALGKCQSVGPFMSRPALSSGVRSQLVASCGSSGNRGRAGPIVPLLFALLRPLSLAGAWWVPTSGGRSHLARGLPVSRLSRRVTFQGPERSRPDLDEFSGDCQHDALMFLLGYGRR